MTHCPGCRAHGVSSERGTSSWECPGVTCAACQVKDAEIAKLTERNASQREQLRILEELQDGEIAEHVRLAEEAKDEEIATLDMEVTRLDRENGRLRALVDVGREMAAWIMGHPTPGNTHEAIKMFERWRSLEGK